MNAPDLDAPKMIYTGPLPPHLLRAEEPPPVEDPFEAWADALPRRRPGVAIAAAGAALTAGIVIGASVPPLLGFAWSAPTKVAAAATSRVTLPSEPLPTDVAAQTPPSAPSTVVSRNEVATAVAPRAAVALLANPERAPHGAPKGAGAAKDPKPAARHAGSTMETAQADQIGSLLLRQEAARRTTPALADDEPPH